MKLVERYLRVLSQYLPKDNREDILAELRGSIEEQVHDQAAIEQRDLIEEDQKTVLLQFGHPLKVAGAYQKQQYLIGPGLFPAYRHTLGVLLIAIIAFQFLTAFILMLNTNGTKSLSGIFAHVIEMSFLAAAIITAVFAFLEYSGEKLNWYEDWQPESLASYPVSVINRSDVVTNLITEGVFLLWWNDMLVVQNWIPFIGESYPLALGPIWQTLFWPANLVIGVFFVLHTFVLIRGLWERHTLLGEIILSVATLAMIAMLVMSDVLIVQQTLTDPKLMKSLQWSAKSVLIVVAAFVLWDAALAFRRLFEHDDTTISTSV